jgi:hypothetical protein
MHSQLKSIRACLTKLPAHFHHQPTGAAYNGHKLKVEQLTQNFGEEDKEQVLPTLNRKALPSASYVSY